MHYSISHQTSNAPFLSITPRKKLIKHTLLAVECGLVLVRLGKNEYALTPGQVMWLPLDCLTSICCFPNTTLQTIDISCRVSATLPKQAGYVKLNELSQALLNRMASMPDNHQEKVDLLKVMLKELDHCSPKLTLNDFSTKISRWQPNISCDLPQDIQVALRVREARKRLLSGQAKTQIINELFSGDHNAYDAIYYSVFGK